MTDIPWIVSLDDHVVEPPDVWTSPPAREVPRHRPPRRDGCPAGTPILDGGTYREAPGHRGPDVAWWFYEDQQYSVKRLIAAAGLPARGDHASTAITFDEMRPGCWQPQARIEDMDHEPRRSVAVPSRTTRASADRSSCAARTRSSRSSASRRTTTGMVDEWCAGSDGRLIPLCLVPLWDAELAAAEVRRNAARGVRAVAFSELPVVARPPEHPLRATGIRSSRRAPRPAPSSHAHRLRHQDAARRRKDAPDAVQAANIFTNSAVSLDRLPLLRRARALPRPEAALRRGADRLDPLRARARRRRVGDPPGLEPQPGRTSREPPSTYYYRQVPSCFFKDAVGVELLDRVGATTSRSRPTTRTRTARGPTRTRWRSSCSATSTTRPCTRSCAATPSGFSGSSLGDGSGPRS